MSSSTFKSHFNMISMHEPVQHKAKFWQAYIRALKGTEDMRANDDTPAVRQRRQRAASEAPELLSRFQDEIPTPYSEGPSARINAPGYKYMPVSRDTYGYSPRALSSTQYHTRK